MSQPGSNLPKSNFTASVPGVPVLPRLVNIPINGNLNGANLIVPGQPNLSVQVFRFFFTVSTDTLITFGDDVPTSFSGPVSLTANGSITLEFDGEPWYVTTVGSGFVINQTASAQISGTLYYLQR